jgi:type II secretory pathway component PulF
MPSFRYESLTATGQVRQGVVTAASRGAAIRMLGGRGETATRIDTADAEQAAAATVLPTVPESAGAPKPETRARPLRRGLGRPVASRAEMANLVRELATALDPPFDDLIVGMLRAADASGRTTDVLHQLADLLERSLELRREVIGATLYPMIVATLILLSAVILVTVLVPRLIEPLAGEMTLPLPTRILIGLASFLSANWFLCMAGIIAVLVGWRLWLSLPANRLRVDLLKLRAPLVGRLLRDVAVARFTRTLGTLASAGIPILDALRITRDTLGNKAMMQAIDAVQEKVTSGTALAEPLERSGLFPPLLIQVVNLGERSGRLEAMLMHAATAFDRRVNSSIKLFTRTLPPVLIMVMAGLGGFVLAAIMLPLLSLQSVVQ